jgi:CO/xanthine dehydrogenase Mo-binding subunit
MAQAVEVEVDGETGQIEVKRLISAHDVGRAINPAGVTGQIEGGAVQGLGWATLENFVTAGGEVLTTELSTYLIPTVLDVPAQLEPLVLEGELPTGPWGATGIGEMSLVAVAPAVASALHDATGIWTNFIPLIPERVLWSLSSQGASDDL